jgi:hypothetical protein
MAERGVYDKQINKPGTRERDDAAHSGFLSHRCYVREPEMQISSHRTMTIFCPASSSLATMLQRRPSRWSRPSMTFVAVSTMVSSAYDRLKEGNTRDGKPVWITEGLSWASLL